MRREAYGEGHRLKGLRTAALALLATGMLVFASPPSEAAANAALGGVGGLNNGTLVNGDGTGGARIELFSTPLALVKQARDLTGAVLPGGADVTAGQDIYFVLYVTNTTDFPAADLRIVDLLDETQFLYIPGSLEQTVVPDTSNDAAIWAGPWTPLTDVIGLPDDPGSAQDSGGPAGADRLTFGTAVVQPNTTLDAPAHTIRAVRFRVTVQ